jgi:hypothetical protein
VRRLIICYREGFACTPSRSSDPARILGVCSSFSESIGSQDLRGGLLVAQGLDAGRGPVGNVVLRFILSVILHQKPLPISNETGPTCFARAPPPRNSHFPQKKHMRHTDLHQAACDPTPRAARPNTSSPHVVRPYTSRLTRSHQTPLVPCAPRASCRTPRASCRTPRPCLTPRPRASRHSLLAPHAALPVPRQLASIGQQQVDEHTLRPYVSCISDVRCKCFIWMLQK